MMSRRVVLLAALLLVLAAAPARAEQALWIDADQTALRAWRSAQSDVTLRLARGTMVLPLYEQPPWTRVREPGGQEGWVYRAQLTERPPAPAVNGLFDPAPASMILAEDEDAERGSKEADRGREWAEQALRSSLDLNLGPDDLDDFLSDGGVGEFARVDEPQSEQAGESLARANFTRFAPAAACGGEQEGQVGLNLAALALRRVGRPDGNPSLAVYVNLVGLSVARLAPGDGMNFHVVVLDQRRPLSFALPGGVIMISTGLLAVLDNEAQLAGVLAREAAHAGLEHLWAQAVKTPFLKGGGKVDPDGVADPAFNKMLDELLGALLRTGLPTADEEQADLAAVEMTWRAGYDPQELPKAIARVEEAKRKLAEREGSMTTERPQPMPPEKDRLERLRRLIATLPARADLALGAQRYKADR